MREAFGGYIGSGSDRRSSGEKDGTFTDHAKRTFPLAMALGAFGAALAFENGVGTTVPIDGIRG